VDPKKYLALKNKVSQLEKEVEQSKGALKAIKTQLKKDFGCQTIQAGQTLLRKLEKQEREATIKFEKELNKLYERTEQAEHGEEED
jgi:hypothetical protein